MTGQNVEEILRILLSPQANISPASQVKSDKFCFDTFNTSLFCRSETTVHGLMWVCTAAKSPMKTSCSEFEDDMALFSVRRVCTDQVQKQKNQLTKSSGAALTGMIQTGNGYTSRSTPVCVCVCVLSTKCVFVKSIVLIYSPDNVKASYHHSNRLNNKHVNKNIKLLI